LEKDGDSIKNTWGIRGQHPILWSIPHLLWDHPDLLGESLGDPGPKIGVTKNAGPPWAHSESVQSISKTSDEFV